MIHEQHPDELNSIPKEYKINLDSIINKAIFSQDFRDSPLVTQSLEDQKEKLESIILDFLKCLLIPYGIKLGNNHSHDKIAGVGNCTVIGCEKTLCMPSELFDYYGKIDCLLKTPQNDWIIVDSKNTDIPTLSKCNIDSNQKLEDFQMAVYCKLIGEESRHEIAAGIFYSITKHDYNSPIDIFKVAKVDGEYEPSKTFSHYKPAIEIMEEYAGTFAHIADPKTGSLDFSPHASNSEKDRLNVKYFEDCINCTFKGICRTTYCIGRKSITGADDE